MTHRRRQLDRRRFLKASGLAGLALGAAAISPASPLLDSLRDLFRRPRYSAAELDSKVLAPMAGETVSVIHDSTRLSLVVGEITTESELLSDAGQAVGTVFRVQLSGAVDTPLPQGTYEIESDRIGTFPLFVVPNDTVGGATQTYEAVFSRLA